MKSRLLITATIMLAIAAIIAIVVSKPVQIAYHKYALERLHEDIYDEPTATSGGLLGYGDGDQFERQDKHCARLTALGYFFHKRYKMGNLPDTDEVHRGFWRLVQKEFPNRRYPTLSYPGNALDVWDLAEYKPEWDAFVEKHHVPNFVERFMIQADDAEQSGEPEPD